MQGDAEEVQGEQGQKGARTRGKAAPVNLPWLMNTTYIQVKLPMSVRTIYGAHRRLFHTHD